MDVAPSRGDRALDAAKTAGEARERLTQRDLGILLGEPADAREREERVAELVGDACRIAGREGFLELGDLLVYLAHGGAGRRPIEADARRLLAHAVRGMQGRQLAR